MHIRSKVLLHSICTMFLVSCSSKTEFEIPAPLLATPKLCSISTTLLVSCSSRMEIEVSAPLPPASRQPSIEQAHQALAMAAKDICPAGHVFDDSRVTYGAVQDDKPHTVTMKIRCK